MPLLNHYVIAATACGIGLTRMLWFSVSDYKRDALEPDGHALREEYVGLHPLKKTMRGASQPAPPDTWQPPDRLDFLLHEGQS